MQLRQVVGFGNTGSIEGPESVQLGVKAGGTITPGQLVMWDTTDKTGKTVVVATSSNVQLMCGVYEGVGGSSTTTTDTALNAGAKTAVSGDFIYITVNGFAKVIGKPYNATALKTPPILLTPNVTSSGFAMEVSTSTIGPTSFIPNSFAGWPIFSVSSGANDAVASTAVMGCIVRFM